MSILIDTSKLSRELYDRCASTVLSYRDAGHDDPITAAVDLLDEQALVEGWSPEGRLMLAMAVRTVGDEILLALAIDSAYAECAEVDLMVAAEEARRQQQGGGFPQIEGLPATERREQPGPTEGETR